LPAEDSAPESLLVRAVRASLVVLFIVAGVLHFARAFAFESMVPRWLPNAPLLVAVSGAAEIIGGVGLLIPAVRRAAGWGLFALLIAVFPANMQMLETAASDGSTVWRQAVLAIRLPLQVLLLWCVWRVAARRSRVAAA
jgi:uncharacterized membrane protein